MISKEKTAEYHKKARELISQMTLEEKISQTVSDSPAIDRLGIKSYNWWNEALHGVARAGVATVFPQAIGLAATFDRDLINEIGSAIATEARAKFNLFQSEKDHGTYKGLTFWSPNVNIFRDPRWGRGHETYGEDPFLTAQMGVSYIKGIQEDNGEHMKAAACAKHFVAHSGPESGRLSFNAKVSLKDFYETYLPAFQACVQEGNVEAVMGAYNAVNGEPCCGSKRLITDILRGELGFEGHVVSDCGAVAEMKNSHRNAATQSAASALAINSGCDLNSAGAAKWLSSAIKRKLVYEKAIDNALENLIVTRLKLGILSDEKTSYDSIPYSENDSDKNRALSLKAAEKCITLLKNNGILPLNKNKLKTVAVIGPNTDSKTALLGNYHGTPSKYYTVLAGIQKYLENDDINVLYAQGCHLYNTQVEGCAEYDDRSAEAVGTARLSDVIILCLGLDAAIEGEQGDAFNADGSGDKKDLRLPGLQNELLGKILALNKPVIVVNLSGSAVDLSIADEKADAVVQAWYPGAQGGLAVARMLFGEISPSGRLPVTFYNSAEDLPDFSDYSMKGRTYRYFNKPVLYPFGYGLSYTCFDYSDLALSKKQIKIGEEIECRVKVANIGAFDSDEVIQLYLKDNETSVTAPKYQLKGFCRVFLKSGESKMISFTLKPQDMELVLNSGERVIEKGDFTVYIGGSQPTPKTLKETFEVI